MAVAGSTVLGLGVASGAASAASNAPVLSGREYPTFGTNPDAPTATIYGSFNCPFTARAVDDTLDGIVNDFVETGQLNLEWQPLEYNPTNTSSPYISQNGVQAGQAALAVWNNDPESFPAFFDRVYRSMPGQTNPGTLEGWMGDAGVSSPTSNIGGYDSDLRSIAGGATSAVGSGPIPVIELGGDTTNPRHQHVFGWLDARVDDADATGGGGEEEEPEEAEPEPEPEEEEAESEEAESEEVEEEPEPEPEEEKESKSTDDGDDDANICAFLA
ncbi:thioredoxin domain-containing protein [Natronorarus salvus]|uniref:hypothetical protein n=1 Tax=Natronorarus salvus TaxID=3117733 RepID=UPI002F269991